MLVDKLNLLKFSCLWVPRQPAAGSSPTIVASPTSPVDAESEGRLSEKTVLTTRSPPTPTTAKPTSQVGPPRQGSRQPVTPPKAASSKRSR
jgi:hypothetical protein